VAALVAALKALWVLQGQPDPPVQPVQQAKMVLPAPLVRPDLLVAMVLLVRRGLRELTVRPALPAKRVRRAYKVFPATMARPVLTAKTAHKVSKDCRASKAFRACRVTLARPAR
jgi:hypothetical protein